MGCCYLYRYYKKHNENLPVQIDFHCSDLAECLAEQGIPVDCARRGDQSQPVGSGTVFFSCKAMVTKYTTITTPQDCDSPPLPPGPDWRYTGIAHPCRYGGRSSPIPNPEGDNWTWKIEFTHCVASLELNNKEQMLQNIRDKCLLPTCAEYIAYPIDMDLIEDCLESYIKEAEEGTKTGGHLFCTACEVLG